MDFLKELEDWFGTHPLIKRAIAEIEMMRKERDEFFAYETATPLPEKNMDEFFDDLYSHGPVFAAMKEIWGDRCPDFDRDCPGCSAWAEYDRLKEAAGKAVIAQNATTETIERLRSDNERLRTALELHACDCEGKSICIGECAHRNARVVLKGKSDD